MRRGSSSASLTSSTTSSQQPAPSESSDKGGGLLSSVPLFRIPSLRRRRPRGSRRHWVDDQKVDACMLCSAPFTLTYRRHHCRRCGQVICQKCSHFVKAQLVFQNGLPATATAEPVTAALTAVATAPAALLPKDTTRVCGPCGASLTKVVHDPAAQAKAAVDFAILATPAYVYALYDKKEELAIGSLSVVVVQARGLPAADRNGLSDPYAKLVMTGLTISGGQEWAEAMQSAKRTATRFATLSPIWKEHFVMRVPRAEAVLRIEVKDYDFPAITDDMLGQTVIPLSDLLHQRRVDKWYPLIGDDGEEQGEVRLILQYRFNRWGEALSRFWAEPPFVPDWPGFSPNRTFDHIKNLMLETQLYTIFLQSVAAVLKWERPLWTLAWLVIVLALTWHPRYIYSGLQVLLALHLVATYIRQRGRAQTLELEQATAGRRRLTIRELVKQRRLRAVLRGGMSDTDTNQEPEEAPEQQQQQQQQQQQAEWGSGSGGDAAAGDGADKKAAAAEEEKRRQQQQLDEQEGIKSLGFLLNFLGKRLGRSETTKNLQNLLGILVALLRGVRHLLEWEYPPVTLALFFLLLGSAALHCFVATTYLFITAELAVFGVLTWPLSTFLWVAVRSLKVTRSLATQLGYALMRSDVEGQMSEEAFAIEVKGLAAPTEAVGVDAGVLREAKTGEGEAGQ